MKSEGAKKFQCLTCGKISSKRSHMREHIEIHFEGLNFPCHICDKPFTSRASLRNHHTMKRCTGFDSIKDLDRKICEMMERESDGRFRCLTCGKMAKNRGHMQEHIEQHIEGLNIPCPQCEKSFRSRGSRRKHIRNLHSPCWMLQYQYAKQAQKHGNYTVIISTDTKRSSFFSGKIALYWLQWTFNAIVMYRHSILSVIQPRNMPKKLKNDI